MQAVKSPQNSVWRNSWGVNTYYSYEHKGGARR